MKLRIKPLALALAASSLLFGCAQNQHAPSTHSADSAPLTVTRAAFCPVDEVQWLAFTPAEQEDLWQRIRNGFQLDKTSNERIDTYISWYSRNDHYMKRVSERANRYLFHIVEQLEANNLPLELALLPVVESAFDPFAYSHGRASGIWQFIPGTGKQYGLKQNWWYDGRRDVAASTDAAIRYLSALNQQFDGDWLLALAAYNTGAGNVRKAIRRNLKKGKPTDFWSLKLPRETRAYVPQLLALAELVRSPDDYGLTLSDIPNTAYFDRVELDTQMDLARAADLADMELKDLHHLNAGYNRWATDPEGPYHLLLPVEKIDSFVAKVDNLPKQQRVSWENYTVKSGDSLQVIARHFHTSVDALKAANDLNSNMIRTGQMMVIPVASQPVDSYAFTQDQRTKAKQRNSKGKAGSNRTTYKVRSGDSLWKIANTHKVSVKALAKWNGMAPRDPIKPGQKLVIWSNSGSTQYASNSSDGIIRKVNYRVRQGDSLARIAGKFNLRVADILKWNRVDKKGYIHPGQRITLFVDVTRVN